MSERWAIMPWVNQWDEYTQAAAEDVLSQEPAVRLLMIGNGCDRAQRNLCEQWAWTRLLETAKDKIDVLTWWHDPPLLSLSATWNRALEFVWSLGAKEALVVNNDVRLRPWTYDHLSKAASDTEALFVSAVGVTAEQFENYSEPLPEYTDKRGGPDFSGFLITKECNERFRFDEQFIPCYCEDIDLHRRIMIAGEGNRIFSVNVPFLHYSSQTIKGMSELEHSKFHMAVEQGARDYFRRKWGGKENDERFLSPFGPELAEGHVTTPQLQAHGCTGDCK